MGRWKKVQRSKVIVLNSSNIKMIKNMEKEPFFGKMEKNLLELG